MSVFWGDWAEINKNLFFLSYNIEYQYYTHGKAESVK